MNHETSFPDFVTRFDQAAMPFDGVRAWMVQGDRNQVIFADFSRELDVPEHSHGDQWELVLAGEVTLRTPGKERTYRAGERFFIPGGTPHSAHVGAGYRAIIVFDEPDRYRRR